jgi:hypothetical protein
VLLGLALLFVLVAASASGAPKPKPRILFDDFSYTTQAQLQRHGWVVRNAPGWPGAKGATWAPQNVTFANGLLRLTSSTDGTAAGTRQTQVCHQRKYREGTYATRVRFRDAPGSGPDGDQVVETFYAIAPLRAALDPSYSEMDFEYLPNGGWGIPASTLYVTTWETVRLEPWLADNTSRSMVGSRDGWHTLVLQVGGGDVNYYVDGVLVAAHGGKYYPEVPMSINYNLWFVADGLGSARGARSYDEDVDWVFHQAGAVLSPQQVAAKVAKLRRASVPFQDTVPASRLASPCNF